MASNKAESRQDEETRIETVFIVEDDKDIGEFLVQTLKDETPHAVLHLTDASRALEAVASIKPSLFILDFRLPGIDGLELSDLLTTIDNLLQHNKQ